MQVPLHMFYFPVRFAELSGPDDDFFFFFQIVGKGMNVSFMWQLDVGNIEDTCPIKTEFTVQYSPIIDLTKLVSDDQTQLYHYNFDIIDYKVHVCCWALWYCSKYSNLKSVHTVVIIITKV